MSLFMHSAYARVFVFPLNSADWKCLNRHTAHLLGTMQSRSRDLFLPQFFGRQNLQFAQLNKTTILDHRFSVFLATFRARGEPAAEDTRMWAQLMRVKVCQLDSAGYLDYMQQVTPLDQL